MSVIVKSGGGENVTPEVTAQTPVITQILEGLVGKAQGANATADKILEGYSAYVGQELVEGTATKSGQYAWKKCEYTPPVTVENPSITLSHTNGTTVATISDANFDLTKIDTMFLDGFGGTNYPHIQHDGSTLKLYYSSSNYTSINSIVADSPTTATLNLSGTVSTITNAVITYGGTKTLTKEIISEPLDYVVSDSPIAYPDGELQGGYWYEKINLLEGLLELTGCTKMAVDKITFAGSYYADNREINHTLGVIPKIALLVAPIEAVFDGTSAPNTYMPYILGAFPKSGNQGRTAGLAGNGTNGAYVTTYGNYESTATTSTVKFRISDSSYYYRGGVEYTLITMA